MKVHTDLPNNSPIRVEDDLCLESSQGLLTTDSNYWTYNSSLESNIKILEVQVFTERNIDMEETLL